MSEVESEVHAVIERQREVVRTFIDEPLYVVTVAAGQRRNLDVMCRYGDMIARMSEPCRIHGNLVGDVPTRCDVDVMAIVELVVKPLGMKLLKQSFVP